MKSMALRIEGMSCGGCVQSVRDALTRLPGVQVENVEVGSAAVSYDPSLSTPESIASAVARAGFEPSPVT